MSKKTYEIKFLGCIVREQVESTMSIEEIATQLPSGWLTIGGKIINASMIESIVEVNKEDT